jgi:Flavodoxin
MHILPNIERKGWDMTDKAVVYASKLGKTRKTGDYIACELNADKFDLKKQKVIDLSEYSQIIFGTGIMAGKPYSALVEFISNNKAQLKGKKLTLFICCKHDEEKGKAQCENVSKILEIPHAVFFTGKVETTDEGFNTDVDEFIKEMKKK